MALTEWPCECRNSLQWVIQYVSTTEIGKLQAIEIYCRKHKLTFWLRVEDTIRPDNVEVSNGAVD